MVWLGQSNPGFSRPSKFAVWLTVQIFLDHLIDRACLVPDDPDSHCVKKLDLAGRDATADQRIHSEVGEPSDLSRWRAYSQGAAFTMDLVPMLDRQQEDFSCYPVHRGDPTVIRRHSDDHDALHAAKCVPLRGRLAEAMRIARLGP